MRADGIFYGRDEVAEILGYKSAKAYKEVNKKPRQVELSISKIQAK